MTAFFAVCFKWKPVVLLSSTAFVGGFQGVPKREHVEQSKDIAAVPIHLKIHGGVIGTVLGWVVLGEGDSGGEGTEDLIQHGEECLVGPVATGGTEFEFAVGYGIAAVPEVSHEVVFFQHATKGSQVG